MLTQENGQQEPVVTTTDELLDAKVSFLTAVRKTIEGGWCQGRYAKDQHGEEEVAYFAHNAKCFCFSGAWNLSLLGREIEFPSKEFSPKVRDLMVEFCRKRNISLSDTAKFWQFNDHPSVTQVDVLEFLDHCILKVKEGQL